MREKRKLDYSEENKPNKKNKRQEPPSKYSMLAWYNAYYNNFGSPKDAATSLGVVERSLTKHLAGYSTEEINVNAILKDLSKIALTYNCHEQIQGMMETHGLDEVKGAANGTQWQLTRGEKIEVCNYLVSIRKKIQQQFLNTQPSIQPEVQPYNYNSNFKTLPLNQNSNAFFCFTSPQVNYQSHFPATSPSNLVLKLSGEGYSCSIRAFLAATIIWLMEEANSPLRSPGEKAKILNDLNQLKDSALLNDIYQKVCYDSEFLRDHNRMITLDQESSFNRYDSSTALIFDFIFKALQGKNIMVPVKRTLISIPVKHIANARTFDELINNPSNVKLTGLNSQDPGPCGLVHIAGKFPHFNLIISNKIGENSAKYKLIHQYVLCLNQLTTGQAVQNNEIFEYPTNSFNNPFIPVRTGNENINACQGTNSFSQQNYVADFFNEVNRNKKEDVEKNQFSDEMLISMKAAELMDELDVEIIFYLYKIMLPDGAIPIEYRMQVDLKRELNKDHILEKKLCPSIENKSEEKWIDKIYISFRNKSTKCFFVNLKIKNELISKEELEMACSEFLRDLLIDKKCRNGGEEVYYTWALFMPEKGVVDYMNKKEKDKPSKRKEAKDKGCSNNFNAGNISSSNNNYSGNKNFTNTHLLQPNNFNIENVRKNNKIEHDDSIDDTSSSYEDSDLVEELNKKNKATSTQTLLNPQTPQNSDSNYNSTNFNNSLIHGANIRGNLSAGFNTNRFSGINQQGNFITNNYFLRIHPQNNIGGNIFQNNSNCAQNINVNNNCGYQNNDHNFSTRMPIGNSNNLNTNEKIQIHGNANNHQKNKGKPLYKVKKTKLPHSDWILEFKEIDQKKLNKLNSFLISDHCPERLRVDFEECFLTERQMKSILNSIAKKYPLGLTLAIGNESNIPEEIFSHVGEIVGLGNYPNGLFIELSGSPISIRAFEKILKGLSSEKAGNIRIGLNACEIDDTFIDALGEFLQEGNWKSGTTLDLGCNGRITNRGIQRLIQYINLSKATEKIEIDFSKNEKITNQLLSSINPEKRNLFLIKIDNANDLKKDQQVQACLQIHQNNYNPFHPSLYQMGYPFDPNRFHEIQQSNARIPQNNMQKNTPDYNLGMNQHCFFSSTLGGTGKNVPRSSKNGSNSSNGISDIKKYTLCELHKMTIRYQSQSSMAKALNMPSYKLSAVFKNYGLSFEELKKMTVEEAKNKYKDLYDKQLVDIKIKKETFKVASLSPVEIYTAFYSCNSIPEAARKLSEMKQKEIVPNSLSKCFNNFFKGVDIPEGRSFPFKMIMALAKKAEVRDAILNEMINAKLDRPLKKMRKERKQTFTTLLTIYKKYCLNSCSQTQGHLSSEKFMEMENNNTYSLYENPLGYYQDYGSHGFFNNSQNNNLQTLNNDSQINTVNDQIQTQTDTENDLAEFGDTNFNKECVPNNFPNYLKEFK